MARPIHLMESPSFFLASALSSTVMLPLLAASAVMYATLVGKSI